jgi:VWFA-related protein
VEVRFEVNDELIFVDTDPPWQVEYDFGTARKQHVIRVVAEHRDGPTVSDFVITRTLDLKYFVNVKRVILSVSVRDEEKRPVLDLTEEDFRVEEDGEPQDLVEVTREERPLLIGILVDTSGSMRERLEQAQTAACGFLKTLREEDRAFVVDFDERVFLIEEPTNDFDSACKAIKTTTPVGGTAMFDAMNAAYRVIHEPKAERRALIVLSDGEDTESRLDYEEIKEEALLSDVTIYSLGLDVPFLSAPRSQLRELADLTGGRSYFVSKAEELAGTYEQIAEELRTQYQVTYASDNETFDGRFIEIDVDVTRDGDYDVRHRKGYFAVDE